MKCMVPFLKSPRMVLAELNMDAQDKDTGRAAAHDFCQNTQLAVSQFTSAASQEIINRWWEGELKTTTHPDLYNQV